MFVTPVRATLLPALGNREGCPQQQSEELNAMRGPRRRVSVVLFVSLWLLPALTSSRVAGAGPSAKPQSNFTVEGKITQQTEGKLTVSTEENMVFHVRYDDKTEIKLKDGAQGSAQDLKKGLKVRVEGDLTESGEIVAQKIQIE